MNKRELIEAVSTETGLTKMQAGAAVGALIEVITESLNKGEEVKYAGFGAFQTARRKPGTGRNPRTGEFHIITERVVPRFRAGAGLKNALKS